MARDGMSSSPCSEHQGGVSRFGQEFRTVLRFGKLTKLVPRLGRSPRFGVLGQAIIGRGNFEHQPLGIEIVQIGRVCARFRGAFSPVPGIVPN
jgi:hypothetical protein